MADFYVQHEYWFAAVQLILAMLGMGATLTVNDFRDVLREPRAVTLGTGVQLVMVPLLTLVLFRSLGVADGVAVGLALIAAIPGGTTSNIFTHFARGNTALSISITGLTTLACLVTTPLILDVLITEYMPADFAMPRARIFTEIGLTLLLPLAAGMLYLRLYPASAAAVSKWSIRGSLLGILCIVAGSLAAGRLDLDSFGINNVGLVMLFAVCFTVLGWLAPRLLALSRADATAIEMEVVVRNVNLGLLIKASLFPAAAGAASQLGDTVLFTLLLYGSLQLLISALLIALNRRR